MCGRDFIDGALHALHFFNATPLVVPTHIYLVCTYTTTRAAHLGAPNMQFYGNKCVSGDLYRAFFAYAQMPLHECKFEDMAEPFLAHGLG